MLCAVTSKRSLLKIININSAQFARNLFQFRFRFSWIGFWIELYKMKSKKLLTPDILNFDLCKTNDLSYQQNNNNATQHTHSLASSLLARQQSKQQHLPPGATAADVVTVPGAANVLTATTTATTTAVTPEIQSSIKEVTSAIVHFVNDHTRPSNSRSRSTSPTTRYGTGDD